VFATAPSVQAKAKPKAFNGKTCTIIGTSKSEKLRGTKKADVICGLGGNDTISGLGGNDTLDGGAGNDSIDGGDGNDSMNGGAGSDILRGGNGADKIAGGPGTDTVTYSEKNRQVRVNLDGRAGDGVAGEKDTVRTDVENITGGSANDLLNGNGGENKILGLSGNDTINSGAGDDTVDAGRGNDTINSGAGDDFITAGQGNDGINSGAGDDTVDAGQGNDTINSGADDDFITAGEGNDSVTGGDGNDKIIGGDGSDQLEGDGGSNSDTERNFCDPGSAGDIVTNCTLDQSGPKVISVSVSEAEIDTTDSEKTVRLSIEATDDLFGTRGIECRAVLPHANLAIMKATATLKSGNQLRGVYHCDLKFPQFSRPGTYFFTMMLDDWAQSQTNYTGEVDNQFLERIPGCTTSLQCSSGPRFSGQSSVKVLGEGDQTLPEFTSVNFSSERFSTENNAYELTVNLGLVDTKSGISASGLSECFLSLAQETVMRASYSCSTPTLITGNANNGIWQTKITVPRYAPQGTYSLHFRLGDNAGNVVSIFGSTTENAYFDGHQINGQHAKILDGTSIIRQTGVGDTRLPILRDFTYSTNTIDTSLGHATVRIQFTVDPDLSGFRNAQCLAHSYSTSTSVDGVVMFSGTSGTCTLTFAGGLPRGTYATMITVYTSGTYLTVYSKTGQNGFTTMPGGSSDYEPAGNALGYIVN
jgi:Ca2+-binding RTX toxin-like protein